jgi:hypothetical protein
LSYWQEPADGCSRKTDCELCVKEPVRRRLANPDDSSFSAYAHKKFFSLFIEEELSAVGLSSYLATIRLRLTPALSAWDNLGTRDTG